MERRYQVFVSSTYTDLIDERVEVMQALLELDCMPAGMELFPAANDDQWSWIKKVIDESDYYIVIIGGRYGSVSALTGLSYTEMEYRYAIERGKPVIAFLHEDPDQILAGKSEQDPANRQRLNALRELVQQRLCKYWSSPADLGAKVSRSLTQLTKQYPAVGWVKADQLATQAAAEEILRLRRQVEVLEAELETARVAPPPGTENLATGEDEVTLRFSYARKAHRLKEGTDKKTWQAAGEDIGEFTVTWDDIFSFIAPRLLAPVNTHTFRDLLHSVAYYYGHAIAEAAHPAERFEAVRLDDGSYRQVLVQLRALGLIALITDENEYRTR